MIRLYNSFQLTVFSLILNHCQILLSNLDSYNLLFFKKGGRAESQLFLPQLQKIVRTTVVGRTKMGAASLPLTVRVFFHAHLRSWIFDLTRKNISETIQSTSILNLLVLLRKTIFVRFLRINVFKNVFIFYSAPLYRSNFEQDTSEAHQMWRYPPMSCDSTIERITDSDGQDQFMQFYEINSFFSFLKLPLINLSCNKNL